MNYTFCTIITKNFLYQALCLFDSLQKIDPKVKMTILVVDEDNFETFDSPEGICFLSLNKVRNTDHASEIIQNYFPRNLDALRWSLKPVLMNYLVQTKGYSKVLAVDSDLYFFNDFSFLLDELDRCNLILSPHWRSKDPLRDNPNFHLHFTEGLFNGGFVGVTNNSISFLNWWSQSCAYKCEDNKEQGLYVDQKYLDAAPVFFDKVGIIRHKGCNVANWNMKECQRNVMDNGEVLINKVYPIIFIHFTNSTIKGILSPEDSLLSEHLNLFLKNIKIHKTDFDIDSFFSSRLRNNIIVASTSEKDLNHLKRYALSNILNKIKVLLYNKSK